MLNLPRCVGKVWRWETRASWTSVSRRMCGRSVRGGREEQVLREIPWPWSWVVCGTEGHQVTESTSLWWGEEKFQTDSMCFSYFSQRSSGKTRHYWGRKGSKRKQCARCLETGLKIGREKNKPYLLLPKSKRSQVLKILRGLQGKRNL